MTFDLHLRDHVLTLGTHMQAWDSYMHTFFDVTSYQYGHNFWPPLKTIGLILSIWVMQSGRSQKVTLSELELDEVLQQFLIN